MKNKSLALIRLKAFIAILAVIPIIKVISAFASPDELIIFYAGSLAYPIADLTQEFNKLYPGVKISSEASASRAAARKVSELARKADIIILADCRIIEDLLMPVFADWYINFARNKLVITFTERSKYGNEINAKNWYKILSRKDVRFGRADPDLAPAGYRTLMLWQLADLYYQEKINGRSIYDTLYENCPANNVRPMEMELLPLLQSLDLDYAFEYLSSAIQHNLKYIPLPDEIDLSNPEFDYYYRQVKVMVSGRKPGEYSAIYGAPIVYALAIPKDAPHPEIALEFLRFLFSKSGQQIMEKSGQPLLLPCAVSDISKIPRALKEFCILPKN